MNTPRGSASVLSSGGGPKPTVLETSPYPRAGLFKATVCPAAKKLFAADDGLGSGSGEGQSSVLVTIHPPMQHDLPIRIEHAQVEVSTMQVHAARVNVSHGVILHPEASF
jgi:hypothetical protein